MLLRPFIATCLLIASGAAARADIAPMTYPAAHSLIPYAKDRWIKGDVEQTAVDVVLQREELSIEVLPTLMKVRAIFWLRGGSRGEEALTIGFPEHLNPVYFLNQHKGGPQSSPAASRPASPQDEPKKKRLTVGLPGRTRPSFGQINLPPLDDLIIRVDDKTVATRRVETRHPKTGKYIGRWRVFSTDIAADATVKVEVSYVQWMWADDYDVSEEESARCRDSGSGCTVLYANYHLLTGRLWRGAIGEAKIVLRVRGVDPLDLKVSPKPHARGKRELRWSFSRWVPDGDIRLGLYLSNAWLAKIRTAARPPYDLKGFSPRHVLLDRLLRFNSLKTDPGPGHWERLIASLRELRGASDKQVARLASETLAALHRKVSQEECERVDQAEVDRLLHWLADDLGGCGPRGQQEQEQPRTEASSDGDLDRLAAEHLFRRGSCFHFASGALMKLSNRRHRWRLARWVGAGVVLVLVAVVVVVRRRRSQR